MGKQVLNNFLADGMLKVVADGSWLFGVDYF